jgi:hypothetical protein
MAYYLTRVELHGATKTHYDALHLAMVRRGFSRTVRGSNGVTYHLPTAEYLMIGNYDLDGVRLLAVAAANESGCPSGVIVGDAASLSWSGLSPTEPIQNLLDALRKGL